MNKLLLPVVGCLVMLMLVGCPGDRTPGEVPATPGTPATQAITPPNPPDTTTQYEEKIKQAEKAKAEAIAQTNRLAQLQAEKDEAQSRSALAREEAKIKEAEAKQWQGVATAKDTEIREERERLMQVKLYWLVGIMGFLALAATVVAIWQPLVRRFAGGFAIACGAVAALAIFIAAFIHYLIWIGAGVLVLGVVAAIFWMRRGDKALIQVTQAVDAIKEKVPEYKSIFRQYIDTDAEEHITAARNRVKALADKVIRSDLMKKIKGQ